MRNEKIPSDTIEALRQRLVAIDDELRAMADDDFAAKHRLNTEADELRAQLAELSDDDTDARKRWAGRAGRKGGHTVDPLVVKGSISSPGSLR